MSRLETARSARSDNNDDTRSMAGSERADGDVPMDVAQHVLESSRDMRRVHSSRSIRGIIEKKKVLVHMRVHACVSVRTCVCACVRINF